MIIEKGKYYKASDGSKVGPMTGDVFKWDDGYCNYGDPEWENDGTPRNNTTLHLIAEWTYEETGTLEELGVKEGDVVECVFYDGSYWTIGNHYTITPDNKIPNNNGSLFSLGDPCGAVFKLISRADTAPKLWRDMTPEEKGALLLAHHEGEEIENSGDGFKTVYSERPFWGDDCAYRVKPKPVTTQGTISVKNEYGVVTHTSPIDITDGVPDTTTIKLEDV